MTRILQNDEISKTKFLMTATSIVISLTKKILSIFHCDEKVGINYKVFELLPTWFHIFSLTIWFFENSELETRDRMRWAAQLHEDENNTLTTWDVVIILRLKDSDFGHHKPRGTKAWTVLISSHKWPHDGTTKIWFGWNFFPFASF